MQLMCETLSNENAEEPSNLNLSALEMSKEKMLRNYNES
jgi:hypothetical protein